MIPVLIQTRTYLMRNKKYIVTAAIVSSVVAAVIHANSSSQEQVSHIESVTLKFSDNVPDFAAYKDVNQKKRAFFDFLSPGVHNENQRILQERSRLLDIQHRFIKQQLSRDDAEYARQLGEYYRSALPAEGISSSWLSEILLKVNVLPEALVLSQAANESAWGTSRFATQGNNYFGQWCYKAGCGLVPQQRAAGATHEVAKFDSAAESVHGYFMNVNRNRAYRSLRSIRAKLEADGQSLLNAEAAAELAKGLLSYSERGQAYVDELRAMIRVNKKFWKVEKAQ